MTSDRPPPTRPPPPIPARASSPRAWSARRSSSTTSTSTRPPPSWSSRSCSSPPATTPPSLLASFAVFGAAMIARPHRRGRLRPLRRPLRPQGDARRLAAHDGYRDLPDRLPADLQRRSAWWAALLLLVLRLAQGFALGGEWSGAALVATENAPAGQARLVRHVPAARARRSASSSRTGCSSRSTGCSRTPTAPASGRRRSWRGAGACRSCSRPSWSSSASGCDCAWSSPRPS